MTRWLGSVRARVTITASLAVGLVLLLVGVFVVRVAASTMLEDAQNVAEVQARNLGIIVSAGRANPILDVDASGSTVLQVVDEDDHPISASPQLYEVSALIEGVPPEGEIFTSTVRVAPWKGPPTDYRVVSLRVESPSGPVAVLAGVSLESAQLSLDRLVSILGWGLLAVLIVVAGVSWLVTGWALRPVREIRSEVDDITEDQLDRRVPVPEHKDEVHRLAVTMNRMLERLQAATDRQQAFIGDASHELRSPIASLRTQLEVAAAHPETFTTRELADEALTDVLRLQALAEDLLQVARLDVAVAPSEPSQPLGIVLDDLLGSRRGDRVSVDLVLAEGGRAPVPVATVNQVVTNLLDNAVRHASSQVRVHAAVADGFARIVVLDDGPGVSAQEAERVFERFVRLDDARSREDGGTGLGLPIARDLARSAGGDVRVMPVRGDAGGAAAGGTGAGGSAAGGVFELVLPVSDAVT